MNKTFANFDDSASDSLLFRAFFRCRYASFMTETDESPIHAFAYHAHEDVIKRIHHDQRYPTPRLNNQIAQRGP